MSIASDQDLRTYCQQVAARAKIASAKLSQLRGEQKTNGYGELRNPFAPRQTRILTANARDIEAAPEFGLTDAQVDRLRLSVERIEGIAGGMEQVASLADPIGEVIESNVRPNGLRISKVRVPLGVVFFIYESRPNVTADAAAICVKSGNAVILRGGKEAAHSSLAIVEILNEVAAQCGVPEDAVQLVETRDREAVKHFLSFAEYIDVAIPRGGEGLIRRVAKEATMPVIKHFDGNCHVYIDRDTDQEMAVQITTNSKCQRMGVCNAAESLLIHRDVAAECLPRVAKSLAEYQVEIRADEAARRILPQAQAASDEDFRTEYLGPIISVKIVDSLDEAIDHINKYGSGHTDAIVTTSLHAAREFSARVDSAAVMVNASTRFNDGGEFGLGAEIGISTDRFHARGPCGLRELTSYKYIVEGEGQIR